MGLYRVVVKDGQKSLDYLAGATRGEGCPLGMWASFENDIAPNDNWIRAGTTFDTTKYPSLALYLGGNTVPERYDYSRLSDYETLTFTSGTSQIMQYDGFLDVFGGLRPDNTGSSLQVEINGNLIYLSSSVGTYQYTSATSALLFRKGDTVKITNERMLNLTAFVAYYKHPLFIKATSNMSESEATGILNLINQRESYSTEEVNTGKKWIDGKTIYRRCVVNGDYHTVDISSWNVDTPIKCYGVGCYTGDNKYYTIPAGGTTAEIHMRTMTKTIIDYTNTFSSGWIDETIVCEYTKNTD